MTMLVVVVDVPDVPVRPTALVAPEHLDANERFVMCMSEAGYPPDVSDDEGNGYDRRLWTRPFPPREVVEKARTLAGKSGMSDSIMGGVYDAVTRHTFFGVSVRRSGS